jgi:TPR repeat protein
MPKGKKKTKKKEESVGDLDDVVAAAQSGTSLSGIVDDARVKALVKAAAKGRAKDVEALYIVATRLNRDSEARFADGDETLSKKHFDHAVDLFQAAQSFGHLGAIVELGKLEMGRGDNASAVRCFEFAAAKGSAAAMHALGSLALRDDTGSCRPQIGEEFTDPGREYIAMGWYRRAADAGYVKSMTAIAGIYVDLFEGDEGASSADKTEFIASAVHFYEKAAELGDAKAQYNLGMMIDKGLVEGADTGKARQLIGKAAEAGHTPAQYFMGMSGGPEREQQITSAQATDDSQAQVMAMLIDRFGRTPEERTAISLSREQVEFMDDPRVKAHVDALVNAGNKDAEGATVLVDHRGKVWPGGFHTSAERISYLLRALGFALPRVYRASESEGVSTRANDSNTAEILTEYVGRMTRLHQLLTVQHAELKRYEQEGVEYQKKSFEWFSKAAAMHMRVFEDEDDTVQCASLDNAEFQRSSDYSALLAMRELVCCYAHGRGTAPDAKKRFDLELKLAENGSIEAMVNVAHAYLTGLADLVSGFTVPPGFPQLDPRDYGWAPMDVAAGEYWLMRAFRAVEPSVTSGTNSKSDNNLDRDLFAGSDLYDEKRSKKILDAAVNGHKSLINRRKKFIREVCERSGLELSSKDLNTFIGHAPEQARHRAVDEPNPYRPRCCFEQIAHCFEFGKHGLPRNLRLAKDMYKVARVWQDHLGYRSDTAANRLDFFRSCAVCSKRYCELGCKLCRGVRYCSKECQLRHWYRDLSGRPSHRSECPRVVTMMPRDVWQFLIDVGIADEGDEERYYADADARAERKKKMKEEQKKLAEAAEEEKKKKAQAAKGLNGCDGYGACWAQCFHREHRKSAYGWVREEGFSYCPDSFCGSKKCELVPCPEYHQKAPYIMMDCHGGHCSAHCNMEAMARRRRG